MVVASSAADAEALVAAIRPPVERFATVLQWAAEPYWKIEGWWEITMKLQPHGKVSAAYDELLKHASDGWIRGNEATKERWAIWNPSAAAELLHSRVQWAELEGIE